MSKIIYRKVRTAPGLKTTDANWEQSAAYYAKAVSTETLSLRDMAKHITSHGSPFTVDVVMGVLEAFRNCCIEQLLESKKVKVEGLGTFLLTKVKVADAVYGKVAFVPDEKLASDINSPFSFFSHPVRSRNTACPRPPLCNRTHQNL